MNDSCAGYLYGSNMARKPGQPKPIREVISHPGVKTTPRAQAAAARLGQTIKGAPGDIRTGSNARKPGALNSQGGAGIDWDTSGGGIAIPRVDGTSHATSDNRQKPGKPTPVAKMTTTQILDKYAEVLNGGIPLSPGDYEGWSADQKYAYAEAVVSVNANAALGGVPEKLNSIFSAISNAASNVVSPESHVKTQAGVGGTPGSTTIVDRSESVRKAWITRRQLYGDSGRTKD